MQDELDGMATAVPINILGICEAGTGSSNNAFTSGRDIPWLQDDAATDIYADWDDANKEDFFIVDTTGTVVDYVDLGAGSLVNPTNYNAVRDLLIDIANDN